MGIDLNLPTTEQNYGSGEKKKALPAGQYQAKLAYYYFDKAEHMGTSFAYQDVGFRWLILPGESAEDPEINEALDENGFYPYTDRFNELVLKAEWLNPQTKKTIKASPFIRRLNALAANFGTGFSEQHGKEVGYEPNEEKFEALGQHPVYREITKAEADEYEKAHGQKPTGVDQYKATERQQTIYQGVMRDILINGKGTVGGWVGIDLGLNAKGYNTCGANAVRPLNPLERQGLKGAGYDVPLLGAKAPPVGAPQ